MKKGLLSAILGCFATVMAIGQTDHRLTAYLQTKQFSAPGIGNYLEIHTQFAGYTVNYLPLDGGLIGELAVNMKIAQFDSVIASDAYRLQSPFMLDSIIDDFYDIKRFALKPGIYQYYLELYDLNSKQDPVKAAFDIQVDDFSDALSISDVLIAETAYEGDDQSPFYKSGYTIIPRISTFYPAELTHLPAYFEIYNMNRLEDSEFALKQTLVNAETGQEIDGLTRISKHAADEVVPVFRTIDISKVPTGTYVLTFTLLDRNLNELSAQTYEFERSNDVRTTVNPNELILDPAFQASITEDSVDFYLASLIPISGPNQVKVIIRELRTKDTEKMRRMIQAFWLETAPVNTYEEWMKYKIQVQFVEDLFSNNFQSGFETDRGRVYLQYGAPSRTVAREASPSEYPYEIWEYNKIGVFSNKKFIFYNPDLVNNAYRLLHSDMIGELKNPKWQFDLNRRNSANGNVDDPNQYNPNSWGNNSKELFGQ